MPDITDHDESLIDERAKLGSPGLQQALRSLRRMWDNGVARTEYDNADHGIANEVYVLTNDGTMAFRHIPLLLDMMEAYEPEVTGLPDEAINLPSARLSFIEAWAEQLEHEAAIQDVRKGGSAKAKDARQRAFALRDVAKTLRLLLGITYTPVQMKPTMEIHDELDQQRNDGGTRP